MKTFKVYRHPVEGLKAVKVGFSWPALFFGVIWMLAKRLWGLAAIWIALYSICGIIEVITLRSGINPLLQGIIYLILFGVYTGLWLVPGFKGNKWRERYLERRGYELIKTVKAGSPEEALSPNARGR